MNEKEVNSLSLAECRAKLKQIYSDEYKADMYIALTEKMQLITHSLNNIEEIDIKNKENKQVLDLITDLAEKGCKISDSLDKIRESFDADILKKAKEERKKSKPISIESLVLNGD